jgi:hypothetical protein
MAKDIKVLEVQVVDGVPTVSGTVGEVAFTAAPFRWGSKMLMKVSDGDFDRGTRIALGHAAKRAIKAAGLALPEAVLVRPRKAKEEVTEAPKEDFACKSVKELKELCRARGIAGHSKDGIKKQDLVNMLQA